MKGLIESKSIWLINGLQKASVFWLSHVDIVVFPKPSKIEKPGK